VKAVPATVPAGEANDLPVGRSLEAARRPLSAGPARLGSGYVREVERPVKHETLMMPDRARTCQGRPSQPRAPQGTIFEIGSSRMSVAPRDFRSGISVFTDRFSTTVSIA
jgi:hypothetical protein